MLECGVVRPRRLGPLLKGPGGVVRVAQTDVLEVDSLPLGSVPPSPCFLPWVWVWTLPKNAGSFGIFIEGDTKKYLDG